MATEIVTLAQARAQGLSRYFTGVPCKRGHLSERIVSKASCVICVAENDQRFKHNNVNLIRARQNVRNSTPGEFRERRLIRRAEWRERNREKLRLDAAKSRAENPQKHRDKSKRHYDANPEKGRARAKKWREDNLDKRQKYLDEIGRQKSKEWRDTHREYLQEYQDEYRKKFPEKFREQYLLDRRRRRAREVGAEGAHTAAEAYNILVSQNYRCAYCDADLRIVKPHLDHVQPLSKGGSNDKSNLQWLCELHNLQKSDKDPIEYERSIGFVR